MAKESIGEHVRLIGTDHNLASKFVEEWYSKTAGTEAGRATLEDLNLALDCIISHARSAKREISKIYTKRS